VVAVAVAYFDVLDFFVLYLMTDSHGLEKPMPRFSRAKAA
jgi:hypothetical protein